jgi:hypothetical protein
LKSHNYEEEARFKFLVKKFKMFDRIDSVRMTKAFEYAANNKARKLYEKRLIARGVKKQTENINRVYKNMTGEKMTSLIAQNLTGQL